MDLPEHFDGLIFFYQSSITYLGVFYALILVASSNPQKFILKDSIVMVVRIFPVFKHLQKCPSNISVRYLHHIGKRNLFPGFFSLSKNIAIEIDFLKVCEHRLSILDDTEGSSYLNDVKLGIVQVIKDQIRKVNECIVVDLPVEVFAC